jgi:hypothetical protein
MRRMRASSARAAAAAAARGAAWRGALLQWNALGIIGRSSLRVRARMAVASACDIIGGSGASSQRLARAAHAHLAAAHLHPRVAGTLAAATAAASRRGARGACRRRSGQRASDARMQVRRRQMRVRSARGPLRGRAGAADDVARGRDRHPGAHAQRRPPDDPQRVQLKQRAVSRRAAPRRGAGRPQKPCARATDATLSHCDALRSSPRAALFRAPPPRRALPPAPIRSSRVRRRRTLLLVEV